MVRLSVGMLNAKIAVTSGCKFRLAATQSGLGKAGTARQRKSFSTLLHLI